MNDVATVLLTLLARTTLFLALAGVITAILLRAFQPASPTVHRAGWILTLLVGWTALGIPVVVPWYDQAPR